MSQIDFAALPPADIIEPIDFEQLYQERKQRFLEVAPQYAEALSLESDPLAVVMQAESYREMLLRQRINEAVHANLLATATGTDLDHLGVFYGINRSGNESDDAFRLRIRDRTIASSTAGSKAHYRSRAIEVDPLAIRDVEVDSPVEGEVRVSVLVRTGHDIDTIVNKVKARVTSDDVKMLTDTVNVVSAELISVPVVADIYLQPGTSTLVYENLKPQLLAMWEKSANLGWDLTPSWLNAQLHKDGVRHVELKTPIKLLSIASNQCAIAGEITLNLI
ncbi:baseplate assembly protein [Pseudoalteromonas denitrificans]|uniref:Phage-related baseplate assembly protein n=1 Tax=Pseudoalteromonas denitrificans DSM 6059 TaxID=1123010 RepID=A0A1I1Q4H9_9GAMM|nr:baseplate J/gp47 family protein [Pseudoalteromonas denitrificans]SFD14113.1 Phage-related baseplate assembly protein [Pseudoalteromonas denitrificans DSM 6059]